mmetsp:Transcript_30254/g.64197  ORF Transcript_30254/g.64197 Transcript_30254/m.64197 type:complete len:291 (-) Transcript_30254:415-1287(-)
MTIGRRDGMRRPLPASPDRRHASLVPSRPSPRATTRSTPSPAAPAAAATFCYRSRPEQLFNMTSSVVGLRSSVVIANHIDDRVGGRHSGVVQFWSFAFPEPNPSARPARISSSQYCSFCKSRTHQIQIQYRRNGMRSRDGQFSAMVGRRLRRHQPSSARKRTRRKHPSSSSDDVRRQHVASSVESRVTSHRRDQGRPNNFQARDRERDEMIEFGSTMRIGRRRRSRRRMTSSSPSRRSGVMSMSGVRHRSLRSDSETIRRGRSDRRSEKRKSGSARERERKAKSKAGEAR